MDCVCGLFYGHLRSCLGDCGTVVCVRIVRLVRLLSGLCVCLIGCGLLCFCLLC